VEHAKKSPEDLVSIADTAHEAERETQTEQREADLLEARRVLASALSPEHWDALGVNPDAAEQDGTRVRVRGSFSYAGDDWSLAASASKTGRDGACVRIDVGSGYSLTGRLKLPRYPDEAAGSLHQQNAALLGTLIRSLPAQKAEAAEKRAEEEKKRLGDVLSKAGYALNTRYSAEYLRDGLARADEFREQLPEGTVQRRRLEEMIEEAERVASELEARAADRERRVKEILQKVRAAAAEQLAAQEVYEEECRAYAEEKAGAYFFGWSAQEVRYCPAFTAKALVVLAGKAAGSYGSDPEDEYAAAYDAVREALVRKTIALPVRAAADYEPGSYLFDELGHDGSRTPLLVGAFLDAKERLYTEHDDSGEMAYHRTVRVGRSCVNLPPLLKNLDAVAKRILDGRPEDPPTFRDRLAQAGVTEEDVELLDHPQREAIGRGDYRYLAGEDSAFDPYYDPDIPF
jgi:chaperonin cofactor prefoldin